MYNVLGLASLWLLDLHILLSIKKKKRKAIKEIEEIDGCDRII